MSDRDKPGLRDAYSVRTVGDNLRLYARWAGTYDEDFVAANGYVLHEQVAEALAAHIDNRDVAILDVGSGTGVVGQALRRLGFSIVDGVDLSAAMLEVARGKRAPDGSPVYRKLFEADLTRKSGLPAGKYGGIVSAGTFTHGHLGPDSLAALWRAGASGTVCAIGINGQHFVSEGFSDSLEAAEADGRIEVVDIASVAIYRDPPADLEPGNDKAKIAIVRVSGRRA